MGRVTPEDFLEIQTPIPIPKAPPTDEGDGLGGTLLRGLERGTRLGGLAVGTFAGAVADTVGIDRLFPDWLPDMEKTPEAFGAFFEQARQGDWDAAIDEYQDALDAGKYYWGASEAIGGLLPFGAPAAVGAKLITAAPRLAGTLRTLGAGERVASGAAKGIRGTGKALRLPWEVEEAIGRVAVRGVTGLGRLGVTGARKLRGGRPVTEAVEEAPTTAATGAPAEAIDPGGLGGQFIAPLRRFADVVREIVTTDNKFTKAAIEKTGINPSVAKNTEVGKAVTAFQRQTVSVDELANVAVSAALDTHTMRYLGRTGQILPIKLDGKFGNTNKQWNDVFSNPSNPAYNLDSSQRAYIDDFIRLMDEVEEMRVAAGLEPRAMTRDPGWFYIPRQVVGKDGVPTERYSSAAFLRIWDEATEATANGIQYLNDPRATALIHIRSAYREVLEKQLSDAIEPFAISRSAFDTAVRKTVPQSIRAARTMSDKALKAARAELKRVKQEGTKSQTETANAQVEQARKIHKSNQDNYDKHLNRAREARQVPGRLFGENQPDTIKVEVWRSKFFKIEDHKLLKDGVEKALGEPPTGWEKLWRGFQVLGNTVRFLASVGDQAMPLTHGLPLLARNPVAWGRMTLRSYQAFIDPTVQARLIKDNLAEYQWLARNGVSIGDPEFFAALAPGQGISLNFAARNLSKIFGDDYVQSARNLLSQGGKQTFGRFQSSYNAGLGYSRVLLLKSMRNSWKGTDAGLAQHIRNMTGALDSRALGVGPTRRSIEGMFLAFSPRLLRSTVALISDAARPWTPEGRAALRALAQLAAGAMGIYTATGLAMGRDWEEIQEGLNPLNGRRFLAYNFNGDYIGIGGQVRSITQLLASVYASIAPEEAPGVKEQKFRDLISTNQYENPLLRFYGSRGAPAINIIGGIIEALPGDHDVLPYDQVDSLPDLAKHIGTSSIPFALQGLLEGGRWTTFGAEFFGARGVTVPKDRKSFELYGMENDKIEPFMQDVVKERLEKDMAAGKFSGKQIESPYQADLSDIEADLDHALETIRKRLANGTLSAEKAVNMYFDELNKARIKKEQTGVLHGIDEYEDDPDEKDPNILALRGYYDLFDKATIGATEEREGVFSMDLFTHYRDAYLSEDPRERREQKNPLTFEQIKYVYRNTNRRPVPKEILHILPSGTKKRILRSQEERRNFITKFRQK